MLKGAAARRYAEAVFELGSEPDTLDTWLADVRLIADYFGNHQLAFILNEPNVRFDRKQAIVRDLLGSKVSQEGLGLALALVESGGVSLAPRVRDEFERLYNEKRGQAFAEVTSAASLDDAMRASITSQMQQLTGKRIFLREKVDPALLGGVTVRVGDTLIDGSVRRRLELLRRRIAESGDLGGALDGFEDVIPQLPPEPPVQSPTQKRLPDLPSAGGAASRDPNQPNNGNTPRNRNNASGKRGKRGRR